MNRRSFFGLIPAGLFASQAKAGPSPFMSVKASEVQFAEGSTRVFGFDAGGLDSRYGFAMLGDGSPEAIMPLRRNAMGRLGILLPPRHAADERINPAWDGSVG